MQPLFYCLLRNTIKGKDQIVHWIMHTFESILLINKIVFAPFGIHTVIAYSDHSWVHAEQNLNFRTLLWAITTSLLTGGTNTIDLVIRLLLRSAKTDRPEERPILSSSVNKLPPLGELLQLAMVRGRIRLSSPYHYISSTK